MTKNEVIFIDTNVALYLISSHKAKSTKAEEIFANEPFVSVQVLNEFTSVARKKYNKSWDNVLEILDFIKAHCEIVPLTLECHDRAIDFSATAMINIYDANIIAAAELAGCDVLYTEDLNHGQRIGSVAIVNPFM